MNIEEGGPHTHGVFPPYMLPPPPPSITPEPFSLLFSKKAELGSSSLDERVMGKGV